MDGKNNPTSLASGCLIALLNLVKSKVFWVISLVAGLLLAKGLEPHVNVIMHYDIPASTKVAQMQLVWPDALGDERVPLLYEFFFGEIDTLPPTATPTPTSTNTPTATDKPTDTRTPTDTPVPPTNTPPPTVVKVMVVTTTPAPSDTPTDMPVPMDTPTDRPVPSETPTDTPIPTDTPTNTPVPSDTTTNTSVPTNTPVLTDTPTVASFPPDMGDGTCGETLPPQLQPGDNALQLGAKSIRLRSQPGVGRVVDVIGRGARVSILSGARCALGYFHYQSETASGRRGWLPEANSMPGEREYWLARNDDKTYCRDEPRFAPGDAARRTGASALSLRDLPKVSAERQGHEIAPGDELEILAGPVCAAGKVWYEMSSESRGIHGWAAQDDVNEQFVKLMRVAPNTPVPTDTPTDTPVPSDTPTDTPVPTDTPTDTPVPSDTPTDTPVPSDTPTDTPVPSDTPTDTPVPTDTPTDTPVPSDTPTNTPVPSDTPTDTPVPSDTPTDTPVPSDTPTNTPVPTDTPTNTPVPTDTPTVTPVPTDTPTDTPVPTDTPTDTPVPTDTPTDSPVPTNTPTDTPLPTDTPTDTPVPTDTPTDTPTPTPTATNTSTETPTPTLTATDTPTPTATPDSCEHTPPPQLKAGDSAWQLGADSLRIRDKPDAGNVVARVYKEQRVEVLSDARCVDSYYRYKVRTQDGKQGWIAEAESHYQKREYWLVRADDGIVCRLQPRFLPGDLTQREGRSALSAHDAPSRNATEIGKFQRDETVEVLWGPVCAGGIIWYEMVNEAGRLRGWAMQGVGDVYYFAEAHGRAR